jgi:hypothetical protein
MSTTPLADPKKPAKSKPADGEPCPNCGSREPWGRSSWCPACGYYPALGGTALRTAEQVEAEGAAQGEAWENIHKGPENLAQAIPKWAWLAMGGVVLILALNLAARLLLPMKPSHRTLCTLLEFTVGFIAAAFSHFSAYLFAACKSDKLGPFDFFMKPIEMWKPTFSKMPEGTRRVCGMAWGTTLVFCGLVVMAGFAFDDLFEDWGFIQPEPEPIFSVTKRRRGGDDGAEALESLVKKVIEVEAPEEAVFIETRCVILGYTLTDKGELNSMVLGSAPKGRLAYVGLLSQPDIPEEDRGDILLALQELDGLRECHVKQGVPIKQAIWVEPKLMCMVEHTSWTTQYRLQQPKFLKLVSPEDEEKEKRKKEKAEETKKKAEEALKELTEELKK